jgi:hypothetical protein
MQKVSSEYANATAMAGGLVAIHLFKMLIDKGDLGADEGKSVLKKAHNDIARAMQVRNLDPVLIGAEEILASLYAKLQNGAGSTAPDAHPGV